MPTRSVLRFKQDGSARIQAGQANYAAFASEIRRQLQGAYGTVAATAEINTIKLPYPVNYLSVVIDTDQPIGDKSLFSQRVNGAVNASGNGVWKFAALGSAVVSSRPLAANTNVNDASRTATPPPGGIAPSQPLAPPPPRHGQRPLPKVRTTVTQGQTFSGDPARNNVPTTQADTHAPPESPENDITFLSLLPFIGGAIVVAALGYGIYKLASK